MPELPEVESIKRSLSSNIVGQKLKNYKIYDHRTNRSVSYTHLRAHETV